MAAIVQWYLHVFAPSYVSSSDMVDISELLEQRNNWSPVQLQFANNDESIKNLNAAILINFSSTYRQTKLFPKGGMEMLTRIIGRSTNLPDEIAQEIFLVHISKRNMDVDLFSYFVVNTETMKVKILLDDEIKWVELAKKVTRHKGINDIIDECVVDFGEVPQSSNDVDEQEGINITLVERNTPYLRGFVGFNEIFIHVDHIQGKIDQFKVNDEDLLQFLCKMEIISITIHELAHLKIRKCTGDFNMHTPVLARGTPALAANTLEFGIYAERKVFSKQVDWFASAKTLDIGYVEDFIDAIENQNQLPTGLIKRAVPRFGIPDMGGVDAQLSNDIC